MNHIEECPKCDSPIDGDEVLMSNYQHYVECYDCRFKGPKSDTFVDAVKAWNEQVKSKDC